MALVYGWLAGSTVHLMPSACNTCNSDWVLYVICIAARRPAGYWKAWPVAGSIVHLMPFAMCAADGLDGRLVCDVCGA